MVRAFFPQTANFSIVSNTNYPPQNSGYDNEPSFDDEDYVIGLQRDRVEYDLPSGRDAVDYQLVL